MISLCYFFFNDTATTEIYTLSLHDALPIYAHELGEARAEGAQRRAADLEADLGDAEIAAAQQRHRALDAPGHQVGVRRLAVGELELAAEVTSRHVHAAGKRLDVQRLRVLPVDPVADATQQREVAQVLRLGGTAGHLSSLSPCGYPAPGSPGRGELAELRQGVPGDL